MVADDTTIGLLPGDRIFFGAVLLPAMPRPWALAEIARPSLLKRIDGHHEGETPMLQEKQ